MLKKEYKLRAGVYKVKTFRTTQLLMTILSCEATMGISSLSIPMFPQWSIWAWLRRTAATLSAGYWLRDRSPGMRSGR
jgi:hypothetical protein